MRLGLALWLFVLAFLAAPVAAHDVRPAYLEIAEAPAGTYRIVWKQPVLADRVLSMQPHLSTGWLERPPDSEEVAPDFRLRTWGARGGSLDGAEVVIAGLQATITDVLLRVTAADGSTFETILRPDRTSVRIDLGKHGGIAVRAYFRLGVEHILSGADHLAFVLGLSLIAGFGWRLVQAVTAFTVAHSLTLGASALGFVHAPVATVEALVALSILFVGAELARGSRAGLAFRWPALIAFAFGLLHGFAFAGALAQVGLPAQAIPLSLLLFNLGVEAGQLLFVAMLIGLFVVMRRLPMTAAAPIPRIAGYAIGIFAAFLFVERAVAAFA